MKNSFILISFHIFLFISSPVCCLYSEGVFLITSHICITHEVKNVFMRARVRRSCEFQFHSCFGLKCQTFDCNKAERGRDRDRERQRERQREKQKRQKVGEIREREQAVLNSPNHKVHNYTELTIPIPVCFRISNYHPPTFFSTLKEKETRISI